MKKYSSTYLTKLGTSLFQACGVSLEHATIVAEHLVESNLMGLDSHGVIRIPWYVELVMRETIKPAGEVTVAEDKGSTVIVDCGFNFGQVSGVWATELAIERAKAYGISAVVTRNGNHTGRLGAYTIQAAREGMFALLMCNWGKRGHFVAPFGGSSARFATNPLSFAAPSSGDPIVLDMSTSAVSEGKLRVCLNRGEPLGAHLIVNARGQSSCDPKAFYGPPRGAILPLGDESGYKGTGLAMMVEILCGTLAGNLITDESISDGNGLCVIMIDISRFVEVERFKQLVDEMICYVKSSAAREGYDNVWVPGELDFEKRRRLLQEGIELDETTWQQIVEVGRELEVDVLAGA